MSNLTIFDFNGCEIRVIGTPENPQFIVSDVCRALDIANWRDALSRLDEDEKGVGTTDTPGGPQEVGTVNESGFYHLTFTSRKHTAVQLRRKVTMDILPTIRRTGAYVESGADIRSIIRAEARVAAVEAIQAEIQAVRSENKMIRAEVENLDLRTVAEYAKERKVSLSPAQGRAVGSFMSGKCRKAGLRMGYAQSAHKHGRPPRTFPKPILDRFFGAAVEKHAPSSQLILVTSAA